LNTNISASRHTGNAAKKSAAECCFINIVERQIKITAITTNAFQIQDTSFALSQTEAMPIE